MTTETISILNVVGGIASFLIPSFQLIFNTGQRGLKRITTLGWVMLGVALYILIIGVGNYYAVKSERELAEKLHKAEKTADSINLVKTIDRALADRKLQYNVQTGEIINSETVTGSFVITNSSNPVMQGNEVNIYNGDDPEKILRRDIPFFAEAYKITSKDVYLFACKACKTDVTVAKAREILKNIGYNVIQEAEYTIAIDWNPHNMHIFPFQGKIGLAVGQWK